MVNPADRLARFAQLWYVATCGKPSKISAAYSNWQYLVTLRLIKDYSYAWFYARTIEAVRAGYLKPYRHIAGKHTVYLAVLERIL